MRRRLRSVLLVTEWASVGVFAAVYGGFATWGIARVIRAWVSRMRIDRLHAVDGVAPLVDLAIGRPTPRVHARSFSRSGVVFAPSERAPRLDPRSPDAQTSSDAFGQQADPLFAFTAVAQTTYVGQVGIYGAVTAPSENHEHTSFWLAHRDQEDWEMLGLEDRSRYERYRDQVPLGLVLDITQTCIYCDARLHSARTDFIPRLSPGFWWNQVNLCVVCGWWFVTYRESSPDMVDTIWNMTHTYGVLRSFDPSSLDTPLGLAREYLQNNPHRLARFDPLRFEDLMTDCLRDCYGDAEITKVGGSKDGGIDAKLVHADGQTVLIQMKRHADFSKNEGVGVVRELHGVMLREGVPAGMVITTAKGFSRGALREVSATGRALERYSMELLALDDVIRLLALPSTWAGAPWERFGVRLSKRQRPEVRLSDWIDLSALATTGAT